MSDQTESLAIALLSEIFTIDHLARSRISRALPKGMELSHLVVLNHLARLDGERTPAQLAAAFHLTRGAMSNTLTRLENAGHIHIRPDWDDARRKFVGISPAGRQARDAANAVVAPIVAQVVEEVGADRVRAALPVLREMRDRLASD